MPYTGDNSDEESRAHNGDTTQNYGATGGDKDTDQLSQIVHELQRINRRIDRIELRQPVFSLKAPSEKSPPGSLRANESANPNDCLDPSGPVSPASKDNTADDSEFKEIQENFNAIKASLERVILPAKYKLHDSRNGIKREDQPALNIISKCGRYIETALKLVSDFEEGRPNDIAQLSIVLVANLKYLQDEYAALLVKGRFDNTTSQLFRSLQKNTSGFDEASLQNVRVAAELSSIANRSQYDYKPRGGNRGNSRGRGFGSRDIYNSLRGASYPKFNGPFNQNRDNRNNSKDQDES